MPTDQVLAETPIGQASSIAATIRAYGGSQRLLGGRGGTFGQGTSHDSYEADEATDPDLRPGYLSLRSGGCNRSLIGRELT